MDICMYFSISIKYLLTIDYYVYILLSSTHNRFVQFGARWITISDIFPNIIIIINIII